MWKLRHQANDLWIIAPIILPHPLSLFNSFWWWINNCWSLLCTTHRVYMVSFNPHMNHQVELVFNPHLQRRKLKLRKRSNLSQVPGLEKILSPGLFAFKVPVLNFQASRILGHYPVSCIPHPGNVSTVAPSHQTQLSRRASSLDFNLLTWKWR